MPEAKRVALIVGASGGIGEAVARELSLRGLHIYVTGCRHSERAKVLEKELPDCVACSLDIRESDKIEDLCTEIFEREKNLDVLVNCAAINRENPALALNDDDWNEVIEINLSGAFKLCRCAAKFMVLGRHGRIVNVSSAAASTGGRGQANYAASKSGIEALTRVLAIELGARGVLVNAVAPGCIETAMSERVRTEYRDQILDRIALKRFGTAVEIARLIAFLSSDECSYITGQVIRIDGGLNI